MRLVVTGGGGFLGRRLIARLLADGALQHGAGSAPLTRIVVLDLARGELPDDPRLEFVAGAVDDASLVRDLVTPDTDALVHLASVVSAEAEADLDKGMAVNLDGTRAVLEAARACRHPPRMVFASSVAAFGGDLPPRVRDRSGTTPRSSYGTQKVIGELLVADYTRRGLVDGRSVRIPTVSVRPGPPNKAASGFASGIIREPLAGVQAVCPVDARLRMWLSSPHAAVANLLHALALRSGALGSERTVNLPGVSVRVAEMVAALARVAGAEVAARVLFRPDPAVTAVVASWPGDFCTVRAAALGFVADRDFDGIIRQYQREAASP